MSLLSPFVNVDLKADFEAWQQAKDELGPDANVPQIVKRAQEIKECLRASAITPQSEPADEMERRTR